MGKVINEYGIRITTLPEEVVIGFSVTELKILKLNSHYYIVKTPCIYLSIFIDSEALKIPCEKFNEVVFLAVRYVTV
jgi:hypothetical protein